MKIEKITKCQKKWNKNSDVYPNHSWRPIIITTYYIKLAESSLGKIWIDDPHL